MTFKNHIDNAAVGYQVEGNPNLQPERSQGLKVPSTVGSLHIGLFVNRVKDLIDLQPTQMGTHDL